MAPGEVLTRLVDFEVPANNEAGRAARILHEAGERKRRRSWAGGFPRPDGSAVGTDIDQGAVGHEGVERGRIRRVLALGVDDPRANQRVPGGGEGSLLSL